ncbi:sarcosine oxidase subunit gamma [Ancylobacter defluvii]|uniref:Sarcosine oxidase subunit gamma n=1 Tax=Ancylobacter defluvii TaxID=1282440 RepID=A0A9W6JUK3_9HYPH|nr:sarcosine oxidase subunit gamma family protein [Ancylobacter defluvii]MBS7587453.1 sarcosine oxidase subunit gamma [Ancylobacter defluvii]GLK82144.1 sarcosine oxidase subunit gamma [Ancylobacter defluvii]
MSDLISPLGTLAATAADIAAARLSVIAPATQLSFRGREAAIGPAGAGFGVDLPRQACRFARSGARLAAWLGPDEWLLIAEDADPAALQADLQAALAGLPHALVDVSARALGIAVEGPRAAYVLNQGCPLDLDEAAFPVGMATRTVFAKAEIVLMRETPERFRVEVWRSFAPYAWGLLEEARREFA